MIKSPPKISSRKKEHVAIIVDRDVEYHTNRTGFESFEFTHNALPEINYSEINTELQFLGKKLALPLMISAMTGGYAGAEKINRELAEICEQYQIAMGVGSQRQVWENSRYHETFSVIRNAAPSVPVVGNIGAAEAAMLTDIAPVQRLVDLIRADAFAVHLNPLQELLQPEGNTNFRNVLSAIEKLVRGLSVPLIVKEIGSGISESVARRLIDAGVMIIDVAGAGGTSWAAVEIQRQNKLSAVQHDNLFREWGIPTLEALQQVVSLRSVRNDLVVIASGGIRNGIDIAKSIALGADFAAAAKPVVQTLLQKKQKGVVSLLDKWMMELRGAMFLTGATTLTALRFAPYQIRS